MSIGARSQSARTYLEKHLKEFNDSSLDELITHGLNALLDSQPNEVVLNKNVITFIYFLNFPILIIFFLFFLRILQFHMFVKERTSVF